LALLVLSLSLVAVVAQNTPASTQSSATQENSNQNNPDYNRSPSLGARSAQAETGNAVTLPEGTQIAIRTNEAIDSKTAEVNQTFAGEVTGDVLDADGRVAIPKRSPATLILRSLKTGGTTGTPELALDLNSVTVNGHRYHVSSSDVAQAAQKQGIGKNKRTGEYVGGGAALGTLLGAVAGGGKGAAIGAVAGAAAGGGAQVLTKGKDVKVPAESVLKFQLQQPLHLKAE
jgi:hypothetical protein